MMRGPSHFRCTSEQLAHLRQIGAEMASAGFPIHSRPTQAFLVQRCLAKRRGINWELSVWEWWTIWDKSGKWFSRGRRGNQYVMCRNGDEGPYAVGNVFIGTAADNLSVTKKKTSGLPRGVSKLAKSTRYYTRCCVNGKPKYIGCFATPEEAHQAYLSARAA